MTGLVWLLSLSSLLGLIESVADRCEVPASVLLAVARAESTHPSTGEPWPWTLNVDGEGRYFSSRAQAAEAAERAIAQGASVDLGLMQLNWAWQQHGFASPTDALEPRANLSWACQILQSLRAEHPSSWARVIGRYHRGSLASKHKPAQQRYASRVLLRLERDLSAVSAP